MSRNISALTARKGIQRPLLDELIERSEQVPASDNDTLHELAREYLLGDATVLGMASFYDFLGDEFTDRKVHLCNGTACMVARTQAPLREKWLQHASEEEIGNICCLGRCHENSAFHYEGRNYSGTSAANLEALLNGKDVNGADHYHVEARTATPLLTAPYEGLASCYAPLEDLLRRTPEDLLDELKAAGVRGRGGAGFPLDRKWSFCRAAEGESKFIVCNADEGDPGAYSDRYLLEQQPHLVLFGMLVAGYVVGADTGVLYIRGEYPESVDALNRAVEELQDAGYLGDRIRGTDFSFRFKVIRGAGAYICGEETALIASIEGMRPEVKVRPPFPVTSGVFGRPTVVNNVETLALVRAVFELGGDRFAKIGTAKSTGTKLITLDGCFQRPGLYEVDMGTPLTTVLDELGRGFKEPVKAVQVGGPLGGIVPKERFGDLTVDFESFQEHGFLLGHGSVVSIPESFPMIDYIEHLFEFTDAESCGKCFPCRLGARRGTEMIHKARTEDYTIDRALLQDLLDTMETGSLCALGGGVPLPIRNALQYFESELRPYLS